MNLLCKLAHFKETEERPKPEKRIGATNAYNL